MPCGRSCISGRSNTFRRMYVCMEHPATPARRLSSVRSSGVIRHMTPTLRIADRFALSAAIESPNHDASLWLNSCWLDEHVWIVRWVAAFGRIGPSRARWQQ